MTIFSKSQSVLHMCMVGAALMVTSVTAHADSTLGVYVDADAWQSAGTLTLQSNIFKQQVDVQTKTVANTSIAVEHFIPALPNVLVRNGGLNINAQKNLLAYRIDNKTFNGKTNIHADLSHTDAFAYYELLDNVISIDAGLGAKYINGAITAKEQNSDKQVTQNISQTVPMLYASVGANPPLTNLAFKADAAVFKYKDLQVTDAKAEVQYEFVDNLAVDVSAKLGYRIFDAKMDKVLGQKFKTRVQGAYVGLQAHF